MAPPVVLSLLICTRQYNTGISDSSFSENSLNTFQLIFLHALKEICSAYLMDDMAHLELWQQLYQC